jgi:hypothetical protein
LIDVIDFMVFHKSLCLTDIPALLANMAIFLRKLNTQLIMSAARHPQIDDRIERVDETTRMYLRCSSYGSAF